LIALDFKLSKFLGCRSVSVTERSSMSCSR